MSTRARRKRVGLAPIGLLIEGKIRLLPKIDRRIPMTSAAPHEAGFSISIEPSGRSFVVQHDETILAAAIRQGIGLPYG